MDHDDTATQAPIGAPRARLDVRPILARGEEPFDSIMAALDALPHGSVLAVETPFDPAPLHKVLGQRGYSYSSAKVADGHFLTEYWIPDAHAATAARTEITIDVRGLEPPRPMELTLDALEQMPDGAALVQMNDRVPAFLLPHLDECGFDYTIGSDERGTVVTIWRAAA